MLNTVPSETFSNLVSDGTIVLCDNSFEKKGTEKTLWEYDLYKERSSIP